MNIAISLSVVFIAWVQRARPQGDSQDMIGPLGLMGMLCHRLSPVTSKNTGIANRGSLGGSKVLDVWTKHRRAGPDRSQTSAGADNEISAVHGRSSLVRAMGIRPYLRSLVTRLLCSSTPGVEASPLQLTLKRRAECP